MSYHAALRRSPTRRARAGFQTALLVALACGVVAFGGPARAAGANVVVTTADSGAGSLRDAIAYANLHPGTTVSFQLPAVMEVNGVFTLKSASLLPQITANGTIVDGGTQAAFGGDDNPAGPEVVLNGSMAGSASALRIAAANCQVRGLVINGWAGGGISISGAAATGAKVQGCYVGTNAAGTATVLNGQSGVSLGNGATTATIGGTTAAARNVLSGNAAYGVIISGPDTSGNLVQGNYIGTDAGGTAGLGNALGGVSLGGHNNTIGGTAAGAGNVISGNVRGVLIGGAGTTANLVQGNYIGTDKSGTAGLGNAGDGVLLVAGADGNTVGGAAAGARNVVSGNQQNGVNVGSSSNLVQGNYIGTNKDGTGALPNGQSGVAITGVHDNTIGGTVAGARNVISGNATNGVALSGSGTANNKVQGNYIGVSAGGAAALPNGGNGVYLAGGVQGALIGGPSGARNIISGNHQTGVWIQDSGTHDNLVQGNYIGLNPSGVGAVPNGVTGLAIMAGAHHNTIGGTAAGAGNVVSGNAASGIVVNASASNSILGNRVGTNSDGTAAVRNDGAGVLLSTGATGNTVGGTGAAGNLISGNISDGVLIVGSANNIYGNKIGLNASGTAALPNQQNGIEVAGRSNRIGTANLGNVISGNARDGIHFTTGLCHGNLAAANMIGLNAAGTAAVPNGQDGVAFAEGAYANTLGVTLVSLRNVISGNTGNGVHFSGGGTTGNTVLGNFIGTNADGTAALPNHANGVYFEGGSSGPTGNTVGGATRNVISGNLLDGVRITPPHADQNSILGNRIGLNAAGSAAVPNGQCGVAVRGSLYGVSGTLINGNVISGNGATGVYIHGPATDHWIQGNIIGLDATGSTALPNHGPGVWLVSNASQCYIGGHLETERNVISGNTGEGVRVETNCAEDGISGNYIGTDATGLVDRGNGSHGISLADRTTDAVIGGVPDGYGNVISGNGGCGIRVSGSQTWGSAVLGNLIGVNKLGDAALGNAMDGLLLEEGTKGNPVSRNLISGNLGSGVRIKDLGTNGSNILGNFIGTTADGSSGLPNGKNGVEASRGAGPNTIGAVTPGDGNRIAYNTHDGVLVRDAATKGFSIRGNQIFSNGGLGINLETTGDTGLVTPNDSGDGDAGPNGLQNFPAIRSVSVVGSTTSISILLHGFAAGQTVAVDLYYGDSGAADPSGYGEGARYLGTKTVTTSASGAASFTYTVNAPHAGDYFSATATVPSTGSTSEFCAWKKAPGVGS